MTINRRDMLKSSAAVGAGIALVGGAQAVLGSVPAAAAPHRSGYGPLLPDPDGILDLPRGFSYRVVTRAGDRLAGHSGVVPGNQDGTASFPGPHGSVRLVNNHELAPGEEPPALAAREFTYDPGGVGGTTTIEVGADNRLLSEYVSLAGTYDNCAGGPTPWGTWLSCEETEERRGNGLHSDHGFVFEVDPHDPRNNTNPTPLTAMGRFPHEAVAIDPGTGVCYLTEDATGPNGLLYRFTPRRPLGGTHSLRAGGVLEAMRAHDLDDLSKATTIGSSFRVAWYEIPDPLASSEPVRTQLPAQRVSRSRKLEGTWWGDGGCYFVASFARTSDGSARPHDGQVWFYDPRRQTITLKLRMNVTPSESDLDGPDNITVSPYGGLLVAEDGTGGSHLFGITDSGTPYPVARNRVNDSEFTGPNFSPNGRTLFANIQNPGLVLAITGPWRRTC